MVRVDAYSGLGSDLPEEVGVIFTERSSIGFGADGQKANNVILHHHWNEPTGTQLVEMEPFVEIWIQKLARTVMQRKWSILYYVRPEGTDVIEHEFPIDFTQAESVNQSKRFKSMSVNKDRKICGIDFSADNVRDQSIELL
jgi:hypothetical protein